MHRALRKIIALSKRSLDVIRHEGITRFLYVSYKKIYYKLKPADRPRAMRDVLFITGPNLPQVKRYRVDHQAEQLRANGMSAEVIEDSLLTDEDVKYYRGFVFCRYPYTEKADSFIRLAKSFNKTVIFEVDDLVFDTNFTDNIKVVQQMNEADRALYDSGVKRCQQTLRLCDYVITTTDPLAEELMKYDNVREVCVNRNVVSDEMIALSRRAVSQIQRNDDVVTIGYFSGSITHNEDFELVLPALIRLMKKHKNVRLHIGGILDPQSELLQFEDRVTVEEFVDWRQLPASIRKCDINLAPLAQKTIFNEAKSEIKWLDAALVESVTVASDFGAFRTEITDGVNGVLVPDDDAWFVTLEELILNKQVRSNIAKGAYIEASTRRTTIATGKKLADWLNGIFAKNVVFVIPSSEISGGVNVVLKHADILRSNGADVTIINSIAKKDYSSEARRLVDYNEVLAYKTDVEQRIDEMVATLWATVPYVRATPTVKQKSYFVQNFETNFVLPGDKSRLLANSTYCYDDIKYTTMSLWCKEWLKNDYGQDALYTSNGLWSERYAYKKRNFANRKVRVLIEGDPQSEWKNVDEAFEITNQLDKEKYEVNFLSYHAKPKKGYRVDNFYQKVPSEKVGEIYAQNDILLKTSLLESFSYPPLEMMATGGLVVVIPNGGNLEYLKDEENCLMFESGDDKKAIKQIGRIVSDGNLRDKLVANGKKLAHDYSWESVERQVLELYE